MSKLSILTQIRDTESNNEKLALLKSHKDDIILKDIFRLAYSKNIQFGIKKIPEYSHKNTTVNLPYGLNFLEFSLANREYTGNTAIDKLTEVLENLSPEDASVIKLVLQRDLECGCSASSANKVWSGLIPEQPKMLATAQSEKSLGKIIYPAYAQLKADGARCFAEIRNNDGNPTVKLLSRAGNEYTGLDHINEELIKYTTRLRDFSKTSEGITIDGELLFTKRDANGELLVLRSESNGIANKSLKNTILPEEAKNMILTVWDTYTLESAYNNEKSSTYKNRFHLVQQMFGESNFVVPIENNIVHNLNEAKLVYQKYVDQGLEGIILKNINSLWENKRSPNQVKFKEVVDIDMEIVDVYPHKKDENKLGGFSLKSKCGKVTVNCGSGLTDTTRVRDKKTKVWIDIPLENRDALDRELLWTKREELIGKILEVECNGWITSKSRKDGTVGLFLPIAKQIRLDKESANTFEDAFGIPFSDTGVE